MKDVRTYIYGVLAEKNIKTVAYILHKDSNLKNYKFVFSTEKNQGMSTDILLGDDSSRSSINFYLHNLIMNDRFNFVSDKFSEELLSNRKFKYNLDRCIMIDNQGISYLRKLFEGENSSIDNTSEMIKYLIENRIDYDAMPYLVENAVNLKQENYAVIQENLIAYIKFKHIDEEAFKKNGKILSLIDDNSALVESDRLFSFMSAIKYNLDTPYIRSYLINKILLTKATILKLSSKDIEKNSNQMIDFCHFKLSMFPICELRLMVSFLKGDQEVVGFFSKIQRNGKNIPKSLNGMAWDLAHLRATEIMMTVSPRREADLTIYSFLTFDRNLAAVSKFYKYDSFAYSENDFIPYIRSDMLGIPESMNKYYSQEMVVNRMNGMKSLDDINLLLLEVEKELEQLLEY